MKEGKGRAFCQGERDDSLAGLTLTGFTGARGVHPVSARNINLNWRFVGQIPFRVQVHRDGLPRLVDPSLRFNMPIGSPPRLSSHPPVLKLLGEMCRKEEPNRLGEIYFAHHLHLPPSPIRESRRFAAKVDSQYRVRNGRAGSGF